ncbi:MAG: hypothetical protein HXX20_13060 [Chloroflexi bacterium]|nr:hypothetical protein [Chloroflexota bacterium]NWJ96707.1 hypothetical protein [Chloroflexota bacterium]
MFRIEQKLRQLKQVITISDEIQDHLIVITDPIIRAAMEQQLVDLNAIFDNIKKDLIVEANNLKI